MKKSRLEAALEAIELGRACLLGYFGKINQVSSKEKAGLVSEADRGSEKIIQDYLQRYHPDVAFLGEEQAFQEKTELVRQSVGARWILDPLDGTTNYVHRFPIFCISLALEVDGVLELGIIDAPLLKQTWVAERGKGAFCNSERIHVSATQNFSDSLLATGFSIADPDHPEDMLQQIQIFSELVTVARGIRRAGAAAYDLAMVGSGVFDLFWEKNLQPWDTAAGSLIIQEAGGIVRTYRGEPHNPFDGTMVAGNKFLVEQFLKKISRLA